MQKIKLKTPIQEKDVRRLKVGDVAYISGTLVTARDAAHRRLQEYLKEGREPPVRFNGLALYHCGPLAKRIGNKWTVMAAGPTTSMRMESTEDKVIQQLGVRLVIGKGGMGERTRDAMKKFGAAYGAFTGGAAVLAARQIRTVERVEWLDLGMPEALWVLDVQDFGPLVIAMDSHGGSLFKRVQTEAEKNAAVIIGSP